MPAYRRLNQRSQSPTRAYVRIAFVAATLLVAGAVVYMSRGFTSAQHTSMAKQLKTSDASRPSATGPMEVPPLVKEPVVDTISFQTEWCRLKEPLRGALDQSSQYQVYRENKHAGSMGPFSIALYRKDDIVSDFILKGHGWDVPRVQAIDRALQKLRVRDGKEYGFLDIGGNVGYLSLGVASHGHPVFTFEPMLENEMLFRTSICLNPNLRLTYFNAGLGEREKSCVIYSDKGNHGDGTVSCEENFKVPDGYEIRSKLNVQRLDKFQAQLGRIGAAKIDVEGFEWHVFKGGKQVLGEIPYIVMEVVPAWIERNGGSVREMMQWFTRQGYILSGQKFGGKALTAEQVSLGQIGGGMDVFLMKKGFPMP